MDEKNVYVQPAPLEKEAIEQAVEALFARLPAAGRLGPHSRVLVKPNLLSQNDAAKAVTTHPFVVRAVILALQRRGVQSITLADSPGGRYTPGVMKNVYEACGMAEVCRETGAELYTGCEAHFREGEGELCRRFNLINPARDCDFIVNLPKMKTHVLTGMSGAVKNLFGLVPGLDKAEFHMRFPERERFGSMLVDLCEVVRADIHLVDGVLAMEGDGPGSGTPRVCNLLLVGQNPYSMDLALCRYMGLDPARVPFLAAAARRGLCEMAFDEALLEGPEEAKRPFAGYVPPRSYSGPVDFVSSRGLPAFLRPLATAMVRWAAPRPVVKKSRCVGCAKCAEICPQKVIDMTGGRASIRREGCIRCFCCHEMCPADAIGIRRAGIFK